MKHQLFSSQCYLSVEATPLDISVWQSLWIIEKRKSKTISFDEGIFDFNVGYFGTFILGICFVQVQ